MRRFTHDFDEGSTPAYLDGFRVIAVLLLITVPFVWTMRKPQFKSGEAGAD